MRTLYRLNVHLQGALGSCAAEERLHELRCQPDLEAEAGQEALKIGGGGEKKKKRKES